ncbi:metallopeptidase TldD-related protein [Proteiniborus sp. MB09-C3]|uniref:metallopeptidase TldD-related protein n=1 Tax=Proteiniborus sp. MB09-C3 TaxID=3050072 RepID=UPI002555945B|nr:metallopeptidase TldD-related protein [Proteiniborus sp. MB09-C3]WIV11751.1 metallopeptidase TldD-related protein [Proteiniborus sp. MB09-C3]
MIEKIKEILSNINGIDGWKINERRIESKELFFIKKELDMNRAKDVHHIKVTVYKDFEEDGKKYRGSSTTAIHPTMSKEDIESSITSALYASSFVKNEYYPLVEPKVEIRPIMENRFSKDSMSNWTPKLTDEIFIADKYDKGWINSTELFLDKVSTRILNSNGVDASYETYRGELEFITNWQEEKEGEEVELYKDIVFSDYDEKLIVESVDEMLKICRDKAIAKPTPVLKNIPVILSGEPVKEFFAYYYVQAGARSVYDQTSTAKLDKNIQGDDVRGDKVNIALDPYLDNSTQSAPYDEDGLRLARVSLYEDGILKRYWGSTRFSHYLDIKPTGNIRNIVVEGGTKTLKEIKEGAYLELEVFSDFQMDTLTGDFAGEIRLGWYNDGEKTVPVTGGSISGNINEVHKEMYLSKEIQKINNFSGPKSIKLLNVSIAGIE